MNPKDSRDDPDADAGSEADAAPDTEFHLGPDDFGAARFAELMKRFLRHEG